METKEENSDQIDAEEINMKKKKKKVSRGMHVLSVVLFMLRRRRKPFSNWFWRRVVESVRKARSEITIMPSSNFINAICLPPPPPADSETENNDDQTGECLAAEVITSQSPFGIYGYGSAMSLRDLGYYEDEDEDEEEEEEEEEDECYSDVEGDDMIDEKAEEFIMRFYEQMKMQNQSYNERCKSKLAL